MKKSLFVFLSIFCLFFFTLIVSAQSVIKLSKSEEYFLSNVETFEFTKEMFLFILLVSFVSQIGDLIISYFKRKSKMKDTGTIIPGHGGILDRIDGMIFALPFAYVFFLNFNF